MKRTQKTVNYNLKWEICGPFYKKFICCNILFYFSKYFMSTTTEWSTKNETRFRSNNIHSPHEDLFIEKTFSTLLECVIFQYQSRRLYYYIHVVVVGCCVSSMLF